MRLTAPLIALSVTTTCLIAAPTLHADPAADARKAIQQNYNAMNAAMVKKDVAAAISYMTPDFIQFDAKGQKHTIAQMRSGLQQMVRQMKTLKATSAVSKVTVDAAGAKASANVHNTLTLTLPNPNTGKDSTIVSTEDSIDAWVKTAKGWRLKQSKTLKTTQTLDGQPVSM